MYELMLSILPIHFIINRYRQMFQLILNNKRHLLFLIHILQPLHPKILINVKHVNILILTIAV